jgi:hypothetical protein
LKISGSGGGKLKNSPNKEEALDNFPRLENFKLEDIDMMDSKIDVHDK